MKRILIAAALWIAALPALAADPPQPPQAAKPQLPSALEFLQGRIAADSGTIAELLDRIRQLEAEVARLTPAKPKPVQPVPLPTGEK